MKEPKGSPALLVLLSALALTSANAQDDALINRGNDPFLHVSSAIHDCATPRGPFETNQE